MAKVTAAAWFPRSYIHLFETYQGVGKIGVKIEDLKYNTKKLTLTIKGHKNYADIQFTQGWSGLHYFTTELPEENIKQTSMDFMRDMEVLLLEKILKPCHSVTYKQIVNDIMSLDFHVLVMTETDLDVSGHTLKNIGDKIVLAYKPENQYYGGTVTYLIGSEDDELLEVLLYHSYSEIASDFLMNLMKAMIRLYHESDNVVEEMESTKSIKEMREPMKLMDDILKECGERTGKLKHILLNFKLKEQEYYSLKLKPLQKKLAEALELPMEFQKLDSDGQYLLVLWTEILSTRLTNLDNSLDARVMMHKPAKKWFFF